MKLFRELSALAGLILFITGIGCFDWRAGMTAGGALLFAGALYGMRNTTNAKHVSGHRDSQH